MPAPRRARAAIRASAPTPIATSANTTDSAAMRWCRLCASRWTNCPRGTPASPATSFCTPIRQPSPCGRRSTATGARSASLFPTPKRARREGGRHSSDAVLGSLDAIGSPESSTHSTGACGWTRWNSTISASTQDDPAAAGEHSTISARLDASAFSTTAPMRSLAVSSSRSRNTGCSRRGTAPAGPSCPTNRDGIR